MNKSFVSLSTALLASVLILSGCGSKDPNSASYVVAEGTNLKITRGQLNKEVDRFLESREAKRSDVPAAQMAMLEREILQSMVVKDLLLDEAKKAKIGDMKERAKKQIDEIATQLGGEDKLKEKLKQDGTPYEKFVQELEDRLTISELLAQKVPAGQAPSDEEIRKIYEQFKDRFNRPAMVQASHVLIMAPQGANAQQMAAARKKAEDARARVMKGEDFAKVAQEVSEDKTTAVRGGDLGYFPKGVMVPEFDRQAFSTKKGDVSPVFQTTYGFHFLKVQDNQPGGQVPYEVAKTEIANRLRGQKRSQQMEEYVRKLSADSKVVYHLAETAAPAAPAGKNP